MSQYVLRRLALIIPLMFAITVVNYTIYVLSPGDPVSALINPESMRYLTEADLEKLREAMGLNRPFYVRYAIWLREALRGNLGWSTQMRLPVQEIIVRDLGNTLGLMGCALLFSTLAGIVLGIVSALKQYSMTDYILTGIAFGGIAVPGFFFALLLIYVVGLRLEWFPVGGIITVGAPPSLADRLWHMVLPVVALSYEGLSTLLRYTRSSMLEVVRQDYITTARAKGLAERTAILRHAFKNALLPVITITGLRLPSLVGGAVLIESVFNYRGIGHTLVSAAGGRDYPLLMGGLLVTAIMVLLSNLVADLAYAWADPRIRYA
jgi:peptide/nickel transport system permease protein